MAWIFAGGSIDAERYQPRFSVDGEYQRDLGPRLNRLGSTLNVQFRWLDREGKGAEAIVDENGSVFGRVLAAAGAPTGEMAGADAALPDWIVDGGDAIQRFAAESYVGCRGQLAGESRTVLQIREERRSDRHYQRLGDLLVAVAGEGSWSRSGDHVTLDRAATDAILEVVDVDL